MIKNKKGFTLIELIIVMAIIGILAVVAIVAISGKSADARDARRAADMSAVQTGLALTCYEKAGAATNDIGCGNAAVDSDPVLLSSCGDVANVITLSAINDPDPDNVAVICDGTNTPCNYGVVIPEADTDNFNSCLYTIYARLETGTTHILTVTQAGMVRS